jgi:hypothetical protein
VFTDIDGTLRAMALETGLLKRTLKDLQERTESLRGFL